MHLGASVDFDFITALIIDFILWITTYFCNILRKYEFIYGIYILQT